MTTREHAHTAPPITDAAQGGGIPGVVVTLTDSSGVVVATTTTNENGEYRFRGLSEGTYTLSAPSSRHDPVAQAVTVSNGSAVTHDLELGGLCVLTGIVRVAAPNTSRTAHLAVDAPPAGPGQRDPSNEALDVLTTDPGERAEVAEQRSNSGDDDDDQPSRRRRLRRGRVGLVTVVVAALVAGAGWFAWTNGWLDGLIGTTEAAPAAAGPVATAIVEVGTLAATDTWDGTLDHGAPFPVTSGGEGVVTRLTGQGATVVRGDVLFRVNEQPVTLLYGVVPMFRNLGPGDSGTDVEQLQANLAELGFDGLTADGEYGEATAEAVEAWQADVGADPTGMVPRSAVIFIPEGGQVDALRSDVGDVVGPGMPVLDITGTDQVVSLEADIDDRDQFEIDTQVSVLLTGGDEIAGTVATTAIVEIAAPGGGPGDEADTESVVEVEIALEDDAPDEFVGASVEVVVAVDERTDVLLVPVNALLALAEGGYGLEVVADDGTTSLVPVQTGLFADGRVEIDSDEITEGAVVGTAGR